MRTIAMRGVAWSMAVLFVAGTAACTDDKKKPSAQKQGQADTETAFRQQAAAVPYPVAQLKSSLERTNLRERLLRTNKPDAIGYVYVLSFGKVLGYYVIKGKVSSTQSQMTTTHLIKEIGGGNSRTGTVYDAPGDDGSYGANEDGIFFFTADSGAMVTTNLEYIVSDQPLPFDVPDLAKKTS